MNNEQKITIAQKFVDLHQDHDLENWLPLWRPIDIKLITIYNDLSSGVYGYVDIDKANNVASVEISRLESHSGNPIIFDWEYDNE